jgi:MYXO-CTERM domain-containing protein
MRALALSSILVAVAWAAPARADAVPPAPKDCPAGTHGVTGHSGAGCVPDACPMGAYGAMCDDGPCCQVRPCPTAPGAVCAGGSCEKSRLCVQPKTRRGYAASRREVKHAVTECGNDGGCPEGSTCEALDVCVTKPIEPRLPPPPKPQSTCDCASAGSPAAPWAAGLAIAGAAALLARRRRN